MADYAALLEQCEELYASVCFDPGVWSDPALADWTEGVAAQARVDRAVGRELRRVVRAARKMRDFWLDPGGRPPDHGDWRTRVDIAVGTRAWRPLLAIAQLGLAHEPTEEIFEEVKARLRVVSGERWMEGVSFEQWQAS